MSDMEDTLMRETASRELVAARQRVERWRKHHGGRGSRIPEALWNEAVGVARVVGLWETARALGFNYERLKARLARAEGKQRVEGRQESGFVELGMGQLCGSRTVVELLGRGGERMRIEVTGTSTLDVVGLSDAFWSRQS